MVVFQDLFEKSKSAPIRYKGKIIQLIDKFLVSNGEKLIVTIEQTNSKNIQGYSIDITGSCECDGEVFKKGKGVKMIFWEDTAPQQVELTIYTKKGYVWIQNIWELKSLTGNRTVDCGNNGAAMIVEEIANGKRYRCNDGCPDEDFDDIIFTIQRSV